MGASAVHLHKLDSGATLLSLEWIALLSGCGVKLLSLSACRKASFIHSE